MILSPDVRIISFISNTIKTEQAYIRIDDATDIWLEDCEIAYEYNKLLQTKKICYRFTHPIKYRIVI